MKKIFLILTGLLVVVSVLAGFVPGQVSKALAYDGNNGCENSQGNKPGCEDVVVTEEGGGGGQGQGGGNASGGQDPIGGNAGSVDPCVVAGNCGNGDHGKGNPANGSLNANCHAAQGEVDPLCTPAPTGTPDSTSTPTPVVTPVVTETPAPTNTPGPGDDSEEPTIEVDGNDVPFDLEPYKSPVETKTAPKVTGPAVPTCNKQECCCECQTDDLGWLKLPIWLIAISLVVIALAAVLKHLLRHPFLTLLLIAIFVVVRPFLFG